MLKKQFLLILLTTTVMLGSAQDTKTNYETATFGAGCFWCIEAIFQQLDGVKSVLPGYSGGHIKNPSYREVCDEVTGHAEVAQIVYDPEIISFKELLEVFWYTHNPTTLNRQGADMGTQYRSVVFYHNEEQRILAETYKNKLEEEKVFDDPIVTEISEFDVFYPADDYHKNYFNDNKNHAYCRMVIQPKLDKFKKAFEDKIKE